MTSAMVKFPLVACVFDSPGESPRTNEIVQWCESNIQDRYFRLCGGDHDYVYDDVEMAFGHLATWVEQFVFNDAEAFTLFKLRWSDQ